MASQTTPAFAATPARPVLTASNFHGTSVCRTRPTPTPVTPRLSPRMDATPDPSTPTTPTTAPWPPADMTQEWAEAAQRLTTSVPSATLDAADQALQDADGDELLALRFLTEDSRSDIQRQREAAVDAARASGDLNRVSAIKEAEMRRKATGSAQDFFKTYVETEGTYVDEGYVDEDADAMGKFAKAIKGWFGGK